MPISKQEKQFASYVVDLMQAVTPVSAKGVFALIADSTLSVSQMHDILQITACYEDERFYSLVWPTGKV